LNYKSRSDDVSGRDTIHLSALQLLEEAGHIDGLIVTIPLCCEFDRKIRWIQRALL
jgi:hypothetical protein